MKQKRDYLGSSFTLTLLVVLILVGVSFLPYFGVGKQFLKKVNILSDLFPRDELPEELPDLYFDTTFLGLDSAMLAKVDVPQDSVPTHQSQTWEIGSTRIKDSIKSGVPDARNVDTSGVVAIEDYGIDEKALSAFYRALDRKGGDGVIRIAVLGDSFIEGDIITADIREHLQDMYGGHGVGFIPFASAVAKYRATVKHTFDKWDAYSVVNKKKVPEGLLDKFYVSGVLCIPREGAVTKIKGVNFRKHIKEVSVARLLFINEGNSSLDIVVNDSLSQRFTPDSGPYIQQIVVTGDIASIDISVVNPEGFIGYGVMMEDDSGVVVDNYSIRGNSGLSLFDTEAAINRQINEITPYDLVILQYGLNVMSADQLTYESYGKRFVGIINYIKGCFPGSSILVMGVGDRSSLREGEFVTMPSVRGMIHAQRSAAKAAGVAFWDTFTGMGGENSMVRFVNKNWAAKDYTHIGYPGGRYIAKELIKAIMKGKQQYDAGFVFHELDTAAGQIIVPDSSLNYIEAEEDKGYDSLSTHIPNAY